MTKRMAKELIKSSCVSLHREPANLTSLHNILIAHTRTVHKSEQKSKSLQNKISQEPQENTIDLSAGVRICGCVFDCVLRFFYF